MSFLLAAPEAMSATATTLAGIGSSAEFPLPDPPQNPIALITGRGWDTATGGTECDGQTGTTTTYQRLGD